MKVQDFKYTKVGEYLYFGVEVNNSDTSAYIGSYLKVNAGEQSMSVPLPYISPQSTIGIGFIIKSIPNPEAITIDVVTGTEHFEYPYSDDLEVVVKEANEATRTITYTIANKGNVEISDASFDLIFYNKGQLVGGLRQKIDKLMPSRTHYVDVRIPPELISATRAQTRQLRSISTAVNYANSQNAINGLYTRGIYNNTWGH